MKSKEMLDQFVEETANEIEKLYEERECKKIIEILEELPCQIQSLINNKFSREDKKINLEHYVLLFRDKDISEEEISKYKYIFHSHKMYIQEALNNVSYVYLLLNNEELFIEITRELCMDATYLCFLIKYKLLEEVFKNKRIYSYLNERKKETKIPAIIYALRKIEKEDLTSFGIENLNEYLIKVFKSKWKSFSEEDQKEAVNVLLYFLDNAVSIKVLDHLL